MKQRILLYTFLMGMMLLLNSCTRETYVLGKDYSLADIVQAIPPENIQKDPLWNTWGGSMVKGYDNKYNLYFFRWPRQLGHESWISHSEIAYAAADKQEGLWIRFDTPVLTNNEDTTAFDPMCVNNPAVCVGQDGKIVMLYKAVCKNGTRGGGSVRFSVALADTPTGLFIKTNKLIFQPTEPNARMVAEDPYLWYDENSERYYAIVRDVVGQFTGEDSGGLACNSIP